MNHTIRVALGILVAACLLGPVFAAEPERPIVGAWRWDAWYGQGEPTKTPEASLAPPKYHFRLPWFAQIVGEGKVEINGDSQAIMDQEIAYAVEAGLDYWAFLTWWDETEDMADYQIALRRYRAAQDKRGLRYCLVSEGFRLDSFTILGADRWSRLIEHFQDPNYQTVLDGRPLLYILGRPKLLGKKEFQQLGDAAVAAGLKRPYLVLMGTKAERDLKDLEALGFDALWLHHVGRYTMEQPTYAQYTAAIRQKCWDKCRALRLPCVTFVSAGWDTRPRNEHPPTWAALWLPGLVATPDPTPPAEQNPLIDSVTATPEELAAHLRDAIAWTQANRDLNPTNHILIYGWNENDEGGWLIPTLGADGQPNEERIQAVGRVLRGR